MVPICNNAAESFNLIEFRALKIDTFNLVERNQIQLARQLSHQFTELLGICNTIIL